MSGRMKTRLQFCPRCQQTTITGPDADYGWCIATVDPTPLDRATEAQALLTARPTYTFRPGPPPRITPRDHWTISAHPADPTDPNPVLPAHVCHRLLARRRQLLHRPEEVAHGAPPF